VLPAGFELAIPAIKQLQTYTSDHMTIKMGFYFFFHHTLLP
jgi:hypothetical protein